MSGYFKLYRGWHKNPVFKNDSERMAWLWLLEEAKYEPGTYWIDGNQFHLERGQLSHSIRYIARQLDWGHVRVLQFLKKLVAETMIDTQTARGQTLITICNYSYYQDSENHTGTATRTRSDTQIDTRTDTRIDTNKKEIKKIRNIYPDDFERFWSVHPRAEAKRDTHSHWKQRMKEGCSPEEIISATISYSETLTEKTRPYAIGARRWLRDSEWLAHIPKDENINWENRLWVYRNKGTWSESWGPKPGEDGCRCPYGIDAKADFRAVGAFSGGA